MKFKNRKHKQGGRTGLMVCASLAMLLILVLLVPSANANISTLSVEPADIALSSEQQVVTLKLHNSSDTTIMLQLKAKSWLQQDGKDIYQDTRDLLILPPIFSIGAKQTEKVSVGLRKVPDDHQELSYQLYARQLPSHSNLTTNLAELYVPVFVEPSASIAHHELEWVTTLTAAGKRVLSVINHGNGHARITQLQGLHPDHTLNQALNDYVLPGAELRWVLSQDYSLVSEGANQAEARNDTDAHTAAPQ